MRVRLMVFLLVCVAFACGLSLLVVSGEVPEAAHTDEINVQRMVAPQPALPSVAPDQPALPEMGPEHEPHVSQPPRPSQDGVLPEQRLLPYARRAYFAFHYSDEAG